MRVQMENFQHPVVQHSFCTVGVSALESCHSTLATIVAVVEVTMKLSCLRCATCSEPVVCFKEAVTSPSITQGSGYLENTLLMRLEIPLAASVTLNHPVITNSLVSCCHMACDIALLAISLCSGLSPR